MVLACGAMLPKARLAPILLLIAQWLALGCRAQRQPQEHAANSSEVRAPTAQKDDTGAASSLSAPGAPRSQKATDSRSIQSAPTAAQSEPLQVVTRTTAGKTEAEPLPWVVAMHGLGDRPESFVELFDSVSFAAHVYVLQAPLPYGSGFDWFGVRVSGDPVRLSRAMERAAERVVQMIDALAQQPQNRGRPAVTGFSQGGMLSYTLAILHPDKVAFAAPVSGWLPPQLWPKARGPETLAPIVGFHGEADRAVPFEQARLAVEHLQGLGYPVTFHTYPGLGHSMSRALLRDWDSALAAALKR